MGIQQISVTTSYLNSTVFLGSNGGEYETFNDALYQMFLLTIVGDYDYTTLKAIDKVTSQVMISAYFILVSCVCLNLYIALLSEMFASVYAEAQAIVYMNKAKIMLLIEKLFPRANTKFENYLQKFCSPQVNSIISFFTFLLLCIVKCCVSYEHTRSNIIVSNECFACGAHFNMTDECY